MKIAFIIPSLANKGPVLVVYELSNQLLANGIQCDVFYFDDIVQVDFKCKTQRIKFSDKINFDEYDIVHTHMLRPDAYGFYHSFRNKIRNKLVTTLHNYFMADLSFSYGKIKAVAGCAMWLLFWSRYKKIVVLTKSAKKYYIKFINDRKLEVAYNGRDINPSLAIDPEDEMFFSSLRSKNQIILGAVTTCNLRKGLEQIIYYLEEHSRFSFVIVGGGPEKDNLFNLAKEKGVADQVHFLGNRINGYRYSQYFDIFVMPSRSEGVPLGLLEAVAMKVPALCSDIDVFKEMFTDKEVAFMKLDNTKSISTGINLILENRQSYITNAYAAYQAKFTAQKMAERYQEIYSWLISSGRIMPSQK